MAKRIIFKTIPGAINAGCIVKQLLVVSITATALTGLYACSNPEDLPKLISTPGDSNNTPPSASFLPNCSKLDCNFDASTSTDSDGSIVNYSWDFGDGKAANGSTSMASHSYTANGSYTVLLTVKDDAGATSSSSQTRSVKSDNIPPSAAFASDCPTLSCSFNASASSDSDGTIASYSWDFGDGATGSGQTFDHDFSASGDYSVNLTVTDNAGEPGYSSQSVNPGSGNNPPSAFFTSTCPDLSCSFDASASSDSDGAIASYSWDFGDGATADTAMASHTYSADGSYTVVLTVTDTMGASSSSSQPLFVTSGNNPPSAVFTANCSDLDCKFDASSSSDPDLDDIPNLSYDWNFGDDSTGVGITTSHSYLVEEIYSVMLTVTDDSGASSSAAQSITVIVAAGPDGQALYSQHCASCHGDDAQGGGVAPPIIGRTVVDIRSAIDTVLQMNAPSLSALTDDELQAIADYLTTLN